MYLINKLVLMYFICRQYTTLISYLQYCHGTVDPDLPLPVMRSLLVEGHDGEDERDLEKVIGVYMFVLNYVQKKTCRFIV